MRRLIIIGLGLQLFAGTALAQNIEMPDLLGRTSGEARAQLAAVGHSGKVHAKVTPGDQCLDKTRPEGEVCGQKPEPGRAHMSMLDVFLFVQGERSVPKLSTPGIGTGKAPDEAREMLVKRGFTGGIEIVRTGEEGGQCSDPNRPLGEVCGQRPRGGRRVRADVSWTLVVQGERGKWDSHGPVPDVVGMPGDKAIERLRAENFTSFSVSFWANPACAAHSVCEVRVPMRAKIVAKTSELGLIVGSQFPDSGPDGALWPDLVGDSLQDAMTKVDASGLNHEQPGKYGIQIRFADMGGVAVEGLEPGEIGWQKAPAGFDLRRFQTLTVAERREEGMDDGKRWKRMPAVAGLDLDAARQQLEGVGLGKIQVKEKADPDCTPGVVCGSNPEPEQRAFLDATQLLYVGAEPEPEPESGLAGAADDSTADNGPERDSGDDLDSPSNADSGDEPSLDDQLPDDYEPLFGP